MPKLFRLSLTLRPEEGGLFCADDRVILGFLVYFEPIHIFGRYRHIRKDGFDRAFGNAGVAVDAGVRINEQFVRQFVEGFDGANRGTIGVFTIDTWLGNYISHLILAKSPVRYLEMAN